jgi:hypothetical protein
MKLRKLKKATRRLGSRIDNWEQLKTGKSDIARKMPNGFKKPGSMQGHN